MNWESVLDILKPIGTIVGIVGGLLGMMTYIKSLRKPKAELCFSNGKKEITFSPHYCRHISTKYYVGPQTDSYDASAFERLVEKYNQKLAEENEFVLSFRLSNIGELQLENFRVEIKFKAGIHKISVRAHQSFILQELIEYTETFDGVALKDNKHKIVYVAPDQLPLNQKDSKDFAVRISPNPDAERIELNWRISAKDFYKEGKLFVYLTPKVDELDEIHFKNCERDVPEGAEKIDDITAYIRQFEELLKE